MDNLSILKEINKVVSGHDEAKKQLIVSLNKSKLRYKQKWLLGHDEQDLMETDRALIIGDTGTGKTLLVTELCKIMELPLLCIDATTLGPSGTAASSLTATMLKEKIQDLAKQHANDNPHKYPTVRRALDCVVVFIDEICKLANSFEASGNWNNHVQANFLALIGDTSGEFAGVTWVFAGAFAGLPLNNNKKKSIGFAPLKNADIAEYVNDEDLIKFGLIPELVGRISFIIQLDKLSKEDYKDILYKLLLPKKEKEIKVSGGILREFSDNEVIDIVDRAYKSKLGVRGLKKELNSRCVDILFDCQINEPQEVIKKVPKMNEKEYELFTYGMKGY